MAKPFHSGSSRPFEVATHRRNVAEQQLLAEQQLVAGLLSDVHDGVVICSADGVITRANDAFTAWYRGTIPADWLTTTLHHPDGRRMEPAETPVQLALATDAIVNLEIVINVAGFVPRPVTVVARRLPATGHVLMVVHDLSTERAATRNRIAANDAALANIAKDDFIGMIAHELRSPLTSINGWTQMLRNGALDDRVRQALAAIEQSARMQAQLLEDLMDLTRIVRGELRIKREPLALSAVIDAAITGIRPSAELKGISLSVAEPIRAVWVEGDALRLQQVLWNLLTNAVKCTEPGGSVTLTTEANETAVRISVADDGAGIAAEYIPRIFDRYTQGPRHDAVYTKGLGLGLSIAKSIVELHGGSITVYSEGEGRGSTFTVLLPRISTV